MVHLAADEETWVYARVLDGQVAVVALNAGAGAGPVTIETPVGPVALDDGVVLDDRLGTGVKATVENGRLRVTLPPMSSAVFTAP